MDRSPVETLNLHLQNSEMGEGKTERREKLGSKIPEFSMILRTRCTTEEKVIWFKADDVCASFNRMLNIHRLRVSGSCGFSSKKPISHSHDGAPCYSALFPTPHSLLKRQIPNYSNCEQPPRVSRSLCLNNTVYCVGGCDDIPHFRCYVSQISGHPPRSCDLPSHVQQPAVASSSSSSMCNLSHRMIQCHFYKKGGGDITICSKKEEQGGGGKKKGVDSWSWVECPLISPRYVPQVVTLGNKLYLFGGNRLPFPGEDPQTHPFAEVYDPESGTFSPLPEPPFSRMGSLHMRVIPLVADADGREEQKILIISTACRPAPHAGIMYLYDPRHKSWTQFKDADADVEDNLFFTLEDMYGDAVAVAQHNSTYWINGRLTDRPTISCYDWTTRKLYFSPSLCPLLPLRDKPDLLRHIHADLFCVLWEEFIPHPKDSKKSTTRFHFTLLRLSKNNSSSSLDMELLGCHCHTVIGFHKIRYAHLLW